MAGKYMPTQPLYSIRDATTPTSDAVFPATLAVASPMAAADTASRPMAVVSVVRPGATTERANARLPSRLQAMKHEKTVPKGVVAPPPRRPGVTGG